MVAPEPNGDGFLAMARGLLDCRVERAVGGAAVHRCEAVMRMNRHLGWLAVLLAFGLAACDSGADDLSTPPGADPSDEPPLQSADVLLEGAPSNGDLPDEPKADQVMPKQFDLVEFQSPVKSQGRRGVCSIFSTVALMEHLYIKEGTILDPDFSEQFLQWSVKFEVGAFRTTGGSNASSNLDAISRFGIVDEATEPYQPSGWTTADDERCTGDDRPTLCYTNGEPSEEVKSAKRWKLPRSRWVSSRAKNIKAFMYTNKQAVAAGMTFFYQSWNHGGSKIPVSSEYKAQGYVLYPNAKDKELSLEKRAGHSILLVGWDDDLEVPILDEAGEQVLDANGEPITEKGFFLIKNSWGTGSFGNKNPKGDGYGWLSMRYVEEYGSIVGANEPTVDLGPELCGNGLDDDRDGQIDCDDSECAADAACAEPEVCDDGVDNDGDGDLDCADSDCAEHGACIPQEGRAPIQASNETEIAIPDNDPAGIVSSLQIEAEPGFILDEVELGLLIEHTWIGDLTVRLVHPDGSVAVIHDKTGDDADDIVIEAQRIEAFAGKPAAGTWVLEVVDTAGGDLGTLVGWSLDLKPRQ